MPITILDYVKSQAGDKDSYPAEDFTRAGVAMLGGCEHCPATLGPYNAYPSRSGYWRCADCIGDSGFATVEEFINSGTASQQEPSQEDADDLNDIGINCPECGGVNNIWEFPDSSIECGDCGAVWIG